MPLIEAVEKAGDHLQAQAWHAAHACLQGTISLLILSRC